MSIDKDEDKDSLVVRIRMRMRINRPPAGLPCKVYCGVGVHVPRRESAAPGSWHETKIFIYMHILIIRYPPTRVAGRGSRVGGSGSEYHTPAGIGDVRGKSVSVCKCK